MVRREENKTITAMPAGGLWLSCRIATEREGNKVGILVLRKCLRIQWWELSAVPSSSIASAGYLF